MEIQYELKVLGVISSQSSSRSAPVSFVVCCARLINQLSGNSYWWMNSRIDWTLVITVILLSVLLQTSLFLIFILTTITWVTCGIYGRRENKNGDLTSVSLLFHATRHEYKYFSCCVNVNANIYDHIRHNLRIKLYSDNMKMYAFVHL